MSIESSFKEHRIKEMKKIIKNTSGAIAIASILFATFVSATSGAEINKTAPTVVPVLVQTYDNFLGNDISKNGQYMVGSSYIQGDLGSEVRRLTRLKTKGVQEPEVFGSEFETFGDYFINNKGDVATAIAFQNQEGDHMIPAIWTESGDVIQLDHVSDLYNTVFRQHYLDMGEVFDPLRDIALFVTGINESGEVLGYTRLFYNGFAGLVEMQLGWVGNADGSAHLIMSDNNLVFTSDISNNGTVGGSLYGFDTGFKAAALWDNAGELISSETEESVINVVTNDMAYGMKSLATSWDTASFEQSAINIDGLEIPFFHSTDVTNANARQTFYIAEYNSDGIVVDGHIVTSRGVSAPLSGTVNPEGYSYGRMGNRLTNNDQLIISLQPNGRVITRLFQLRHEK